MKREVPLALAFILSVAIILSSFIANPTFATIKQNLDIWYTMVTAWAIAVGIVSLSQVHGRKVKGRREDWMYSVVLLVSMFGMIIYGVFVAKNPDHEGWAWLYNQILAPMGGTLFSLLTFFLASAAYRTFRGRNLDAVVLLVSAVIMMLGRVPVGSLLLGKWVPLSAGWILRVPNAASMRAIKIGATLGGVSTAFRIMVGLERGYLSAGGE